MSHVDEGLLHAYLDGALDDMPAAEAARIRRHLASCEECSMRLDEAKSFRDEASAILGIATPTLGDLPSLEDLRMLGGARAAASGRRAGAPGRHMQRLAWAASVVLALAGGWMLRGAPVIPSVGRGGEGGADVVPAGGGIALQDEGERDVPELAAPTVGAAEAKIVAATGSVPPRAAGSAAAAESFRSHAAEAPAARITEDAPTAFESLGSVDARTVSEPPVFTDDLPALADAREALARPEAGPATSPTAPSPARSTPVGGPRSLQLGAQATPQPPASLALQREAARDLTAGNVAGAAFGRSEERTSAEEISDDAPGSLVVPGLTVLSVSWLEGNPPGAVQVLQLLESGDTLELVHLPGTVNPSMLPPSADDGRTGLVLARGDGWLVVRARVARAELEELVRGMEGGR